MNLLTDFTSLLFIVLTVQNIPNCRGRIDEKSQLKLSFTDDNRYALPTQYIAGSMHYFRVHPSKWQDSLRKMKWAGLHAVQTYIEWASHEPQPEVYDFSEGRDIGSFLTMAKSEGLFVILRVGPFICAERDMGGLPYWLLKVEPEVKLRTSDPKFMKYVKRWFDILLPILRPFMQEMGGPVMMVQVENEYGIWEEHDFQYLNDLANMLKSGLGPSTFLFSTDNGKTQYLKNSKIPGVYATVDFGPDANFTSEFQAQRLFEPTGLLINSEFYTGWLDHWGSPHFKTSSEVLCSALKKLLEMGASVNLYVFHGGTSFGYSAGSNLDGGKFQATPTSYDYDAPLNEAGDPTEKYFAIREIIKKFFPVPAGIPPTPSKKYGYGDVLMTPIATVFDIIDASTDSQLSEKPLTFEKLGLSSGLVAYQTVLHKRISDPAVLTLMDTHDRGYVYIDRKYQGMVTREELFQLPIFGYPNQTLTVLVESQGRISVGANLNDFKGLTTYPLINGNVLKNWKMTPIIHAESKILIGLQTKMNKGKFLSNFRHVESLKNHFDPRMRFYEGTLEIAVNTPPRDTFVRLDNWTKGYIWMNDFLLGRYWPVMGPQLTLYVPCGILNQGSNKIMVLELEGMIMNKKGAFTITFVDKPQINGPTPLN